MDSQGSVDYGLLIELVQANEHLFDLNNKDYKNTEKKKATWAEIANVLNLTKKKGQTLRTITATLEMEGLNTPRSLSSSSSNRPSSSSWDDDIVMSPEEHVVSENLDEDEVAVEEISTPKAKIISRFISVLSSVYNVQNNGTAKLFAIRESILNDSTPRANKRRRPDGEFSEILDLAKRLTASLENKPQQTDSNRTFVEYMYSCLSEMTVEEAKNKRKAILPILD
ncbi:hypothetical protein NQ314_010949 [Rhamnusium bicolor]|uniref:MADF domain-containing protein n=1 Tax=Rhamnusium bicolor TaxID=1586634 RepID=A0AAV8XMT5_9CUCU|nr:hypothetical protein NQ314_010949 [Rhamnusium bicolor]